MLKLPEEFHTSNDPVLRAAYASYVTEFDEKKIISEDKMALARRYDVPGLDRVATICHWGRSGSLLLSSYLDSHPDLIVMPYSTSESIYPFFEAYGALSLWEKLIVYPTFSGVHKKSEGDFFMRGNPSGDFAIDAKNYYEAVSTLFALYSDETHHNLGSRRDFFRFVHAAYAIAVGISPETPRPMMIHAQHYLDEKLARRLVDDFPGAKFMHTVRDPITAIDSWFERKLDMESFGCNYQIDSMGHYLDPAVGTMLDLVRWDSGHESMSERTRAVRFEDMHVRPEETMRRIAEWLAIPYRPCLIESTWNGEPYVVTVRGVPVCGANPANAQRRSKNLDFADRFLIFALLYDNFLAWKYPFPQAMRKRWLRRCVVGLLWLVPMKIEWLTARLIVLKQALPNMHKHRTGFALGAPLFIIKRRVRMMWLIAHEYRRRIRGKHLVMKLV